MGIVRTFLHNEHGATAVEYGLIAALIAMVVVAALTLLGDPVNGLFGSVKDQFDKVDTFLQ
ncbi:Flp family type IVb pilin [Pelagibacterium luteolum]|uniref:Flp family type IVb pilin n=1 Tax=Pelagibacterium luteolum TaxID=440168 RepID=UPI000B8038BD|nr:Flp family type IVb pilin [Pelagibacterium luteolum]